MSWYEEAADEVSEWTQKTGHSLRSEIAAIIAQHDPARWRDVKAEPPQVDGGEYEIFGMVGEHQIYGRGWWDADRKLFHNNLTYRKIYHHSATHYRGLNFPKKVE